MNNKIQVVNWNISYMGNHESKLDFLFSLLHGNYCVLLQEVKPHVYEYIKSKYQDNTIIYSLNYRTPSKFDSDARKLGVMIILSKNFLVKECVLTKSYQISLIVWKNFQTKEIH